MRTKICWGFRSRNQLPLLMVWKEFRRGVADMRKHGWLLNEERERSDLYSALFYDMEKGKTPGGD